MCDEAGKLLRAPATTTTAPRPPTPRESTWQESSSRSAAPPPAKTSKGLLAASLLLNAALAAVCAWSLLRPQEPTDASDIADKRPRDETGQRLADILANSYPGWKSGSLDAFLEPTSAKSWKNSSNQKQQLVYQFLAETYSLAVQSSHKQQP